MFGLNSRQSNDAVSEAQAVIKSQHELVEMHLENAKKKAEYTEKSIARIEGETKADAKSPRKIVKLKKRLEKEIRKRDKWQYYFDTETFPPVVFGSKKLFRERCKGNISKEEWHEARNNRYVSRGDKTKGGNLNTRIHVVENTIYLEIAAEPVNKGKAVRYNRVSVPIYLAHKPSKKTVNSTGSTTVRWYWTTLRPAVHTRSKFSAETEGITFTSLSKKLLRRLIRRQGVVGVDTNPDGLGRCRGR